MQKFVAKGVLFYLAVALVICRVRGEGSFCHGSYEHAGNILCDPNSICSLSDFAISCYCNEGYVGDASKLGTGCFVAGSEMREERDADPAWRAGMWLPKVELKPCWGNYIFAGKLLCQPGTQCMASEHPFRFKCQCPSGKSGDGFDPSWGGQGCR